MARGSGPKGSGTLTGVAGDARPGKPARSDTPPHSLRRRSGKGQDPILAPPPEMQHSSPHPALRAPPSCAPSRGLPTGALLPPSQFSGVPSCPFSACPFLTPPASGCFLLPSTPSPPAPPPDSEGRERTGLRTGGGAAPASRSSSDAAAAAAAALRSPARAPRQLRSALAVASLPAQLPARLAAESALSKPSTLAERVMSQSAPGRRGESELR